MTVASSAGPISVPPPGSAMELPRSEASQRKEAESTSGLTVASQKSTSDRASGESTSETFHAALRAQRLASGGVPVADARAR